MSVLQRTCQVFDNALIRTQWLAVLLEHFECTCHAHVIARTLQQPFSVNRIYFLELLEAAN